MKTVNANGLTRQQNELTNESQTNVTVSVTTKACACTHEANTDKTESGRTNKTEKTNKQHTENRLVWCCEQDRTNGRSSDNDRWRSHPLSSFISTVLGWTLKCFCYRHPRLTGLNPRALAGTSARDTNIFTVSIGLNPTQAQKIPWRAQEACLDNWNEIPYAPR